MRGRDDDRSVGVKGAVGEVGHRGRGEAQVDDIGALAEDSAGEPVEHGLGMDAAITPDHDLFRLGESDIGAPDALRDLLVEILAENTTNVVSLEYSCHDKLRFWFSRISETRTRVEPVKDGEPYIKARESGESTAGEKGKVPVRL